jgi:hypothetical protein
LVGFTAVRNLDRCEKLLFDERLVFVVDSTAVENGVIGGCTVLQSVSVCIVPHAQFPRPTKGVALQPKIVVDTKARIDFSEPLQEHHGFFGIDAFTVTA